MLRDQLHWFPIRGNAVHGRGPTYLSRTCNPVREVDARAHLRSAVRGDLTVPRTKTRRFGPRSFRVSGPVVWNSLPEDIRIPELRAGTFQIYVENTILSLNPAKTEFLLIGLPAQLSKIHNPTLTISSNTTIQPVSSARNLGIIFDSNLSFSDHISYISKSRFSHIRDLRRIRNTLDHKTACTTATSLIHSKLDYCNSLYILFKQKGPLRPLTVNKN